MGSDDNNGVGKQKCACAGGGEKGVIYKKNIERTPPSPPFAYVWFNTTIILPAFPHLHHYCPPCLPASPPPLTPVRDGLVLRLPVPEVEALDWLKCIEPVVHQSVGASADHHCGCVSSLRN